jgi:hypothetical protein
MELIKGQWYKISDVMGICYIKPFENIQIKSENIVEGEYLKDKVYCADKNCFYYIAHNDKIEMVSEEHIQNEKMRAL